MISFKSKLVLTLLALNIGIFKCDLSIFPEETSFQNPSFKYNAGLNAISDEDGKLSLFSNTNECPEKIKCELDESKLDKVTLCGDFCAVQISDILEKNRIESSYTQEEKADSNKTDSSETGEQPTKILNSEGFLFYYRQFVHNFLDEIDEDNFIGDTLYVNVRLVLTAHQIDKLKEFSKSLNDRGASSVIQEATDILNNMFSHVEHFKVEAYAEQLSKVVISVALDARVQIALVLMIIVIIMASILFNQIRKNKFTVKSLVLMMIMLVFIISVVNNHFLIIQKNQIFKNQKLNEKIPEECYGTSVTLAKDEKNANIFSKTMTHLKGYFKLKPTSKVCLEFQEALLIDGKHANFIETIIFTITEAIRPISILFGESINLFYSSLTKNLSFYQYMPLMGVVTVVMIPLLVYMMSLLSLIIFGYEFNFFHLISLKKSSKNSESISKEEVLKLLDIVKKQNETFEAIKGKEKANIKYISHKKPKKLALADSVPITESKMAFSLSESIMANTMTASEVSPSKIRTINANSLDDSLYQKPESYYTESEEIEEIELSTNPSKHETTLNESLAEEINRLVQNTASLDEKNKKEAEAKEILEFENKKLKEMICYQKMNESSEIDVNPTVFLSPINQVSIGLSKTINKNSSARSLKHSYVKTTDVSDNEYGDEDEDIVVILDEK